MLLKLRNRPARRLQAVPLADCTERHRLQARREHRTTNRRRDARPVARVHYATRAARGASIEASGSFTPFLRHGAFSNARERQA